MRHTHLAILSLVALIACNAILGNEDGNYIRGGGASTGSSSGGASSGSGGDGGPGDCEANLSTDPANCGRCGHVCVVGACATGRCQDVVFGLGSTFLTSAAVDEAHLYVNDLTEIIRVMFDGGAPATVGAPAPDSGPMNFQTISARAGDAVYVVQRGVDSTEALVRCVVPCTNAVLVSPFGPKILAVVGDADSVFWTVTDAGLHRATAKEPGGPASLVVPQTGGNQLLARSREYLYWSTSAGAIFRARIADAALAPTQVKPAGAAALLGLAADDAHVGWIEVGRDEISVADADGANTRKLTTIDPAGLTEVELASDGNDLYWRLDYGFRRGIWRCSLTNPCDAAEVVAPVSTARLGGPSLGPSVIAWHTNDEVHVISR